MASTLKVHTKYLDHDGGTKFYEMVIIEETQQGAQQAMLIKRWGKIANRHSGGQTKVERYCTATEAFAELNIMAGEKRRVRKGERYFDAEAPSVGLHMYAGKAVNEETLAFAVKNHYGQNSEEYKAVNDFFDLSIEDISGEDAVVVEDPEPEPEPERGDGWASW